MSVRERSLGLLATLARPFKLPVQLLHELTHIAAAAPWLEDWRLVVGPTDSEDELAVDVAFAEGAPAWGIAVAYLAPMLTGLVGALTVAGSLSVGGLAPPATTLDLALWSAAGLGWFLYTAPSYADVAGAVALARGGADE